MRRCWMLVMPIVIMFMTVFRFAMPSLANQLTNSYAPTLWDPQWGITVPQFTLYQCDTAQSEPGYIEVTYTEDDGLIEDYQNYPYSQAVTISSAQYNEDRSTGQYSDWSYGDPNLSPFSIIYSSNDEPWWGGRSYYSFDMSSVCNDEQDVTIYLQNSDGIYTFENGAMWVFYNGQID